MEDKKQDSKQPEAPDKTKLTRDHRAVAQTGKTFTRPGTEKKG